MMMTFIWDVNGKMCIWMNITTIDQAQKIVALHFNDSKSRTFIIGYANQGLSIGLWHSALAPLVFLTSKLLVERLLVKQGVETTTL
jgi:hypothetical protein